MWSSQPLPRRALAIVALASLSWLAFTAFDPGATVGQEPADNATPGLEVLGHGPVHEAFAQPATDKVEVEVSFKKAPPQPVEELPPDVKPEGDNVQWLPGYWAFDTERDDFIWVSGFWRNVPPGRVWVPGYWTAANGDNRWVSGYWTEAGQNQVEYYPPPPEPIVEVPPPPVDNESIYVSGMWLYRDNRYAWRPGYWAPYRQDYLWTASRYSWTPAGYVFVNGYWDYDFSRRGTLFAPVAFGPQYFATNRFYAPQAVISIQPLFGALFVQPRYGHYYFGDYYAPRYAQLGFTPWFNYRANARYPDPTFAYYSARNRGDARWADNMRESYAARQSGQQTAPPRRFNPAQAPAGGNVANQNVNLVMTLNQAEKNSVLNLKRVSKEEANLQRTRVADARTLSAARQNNEKKLQGDGPRQQPVQAQLPLPAVAGGGKQTGQLPPVPKEPPVSQKVPEPKGKQKQPATQVESPKGKQPDRKDTDPPMPKLTPKDPKGQPPIDQPKGKQPDRKDTDPPMPKLTPKDPKGQPPVDQPKGKQPDRKDADVPKSKSATLPKDPQVQPPVEPAPQPKLQPPQPKPPVDPQPKAQPPELKPPQPQPKAAPQPVPQPAPQPKAAPPQPKAAPQPPPQPKAAPQPPPQPAPQPKAAPPQPKAAPQPPPQPAPQPKAAPPQPKAAPQPPPQPAPQPKAAPPQPKAAPQPPPQPAPQPKAAPPQPKAAPQPPPQQRPAPNPPEARPQNPPPGPGPVQGGPKGGQKKGKD